MMFTPAEMCDLRVHCGYTLAAAKPGSQEAKFDAVLASLSEPAEALVRVRLQQLVDLAQDLYLVRENADTAEAAVWKRNAGELAEREKLYLHHRLTLCSIMGVEPGPGL